MTGISGWAIFSWEKWYQDQPFWLSGSYSRARYVPMSGYKIFPSQVKPHLKNPGTIDLFRTLLWSTVIFFTLLDRTSFLHYNNTKIIKFGWKLFILWVISYRLSFLDLPLICHRASKLWKSGITKILASNRHLLLLLLLLLCIVEALYYSLLLLLLCVVFLGGGYADIWVGCDCAILNPLSPLSSTMPLQKVNHIVQDMKK